MAKKKLGFEDLGGFVFSTDNDFDVDADSDQIETPEPKDQHLEAHFSNKGRGGKIVTVIKGFEGKDEDLNTLGKALKKKCGVGGSVKDNEIIIQGDVRNKVMEFLKQDGYRVKRVGG
ncbi:translation initiation factor [Gillisia sp. CAL575]|uniref:translation initiation factor n=1 Tax=Gillisia sp. CAL575 TaxID=985255 RepID=UPI0003A8ED93|nr:translation initiation factor [Gillisia sp. CAL575]